MLCFFSIKSEWPSVVHCGGPFQVLFVVAFAIAKGLLFSLVYFSFLLSIV